VDNFGLFFSGLFRGGQDSILFQKLIKFYCQILDLVSLTKTSTAAYVGGPKTSRLGPPSRRGGPAKRELQTNLLKFAWFAQKN